MNAIQDSCFMATIEPSMFAILVRETRQHLEFSQVEFAAKLEVSFQSVDRWENGRTNALPVMLKQIEHLLNQMGDPGKDLRVKYFSARGRKLNV